MRITPEQEKRRLRWADFANKREPRLCWAHAVTWAMFESPDALSECTVSNSCFNAGRELICWCGKHERHSVVDAGLVEVNS